MKQKIEKTINIPILNQESEDLLDTSEFDESPISKLEDLTFLSISYYLKKAVLIENLHIGG